MTIKEEADHLRQLADAVPCSQVSDLSRPLDNIRSVVEQTLPDPAILGLLENAVAAIAEATGQLIYLRTKIGQAATSHEGLRDAPDDVKTGQGGDRAEGDDSAQSTGEDSKKKSSIPPHVKKRMDEGRKFNEDNWHRYPSNEVILDNNKVLDSYKPGEEIVSRKHTQIAEVQPGTWQGYLNEHATKYSPGETIKDSPTMREKYPDLVGEELEGRQILEVPEQNKDVPEDAISAAAKLGIRIRDVNGHVYKRPSKET